MPRNVLMVCYYFPPLLDVGWKRSVALAKYFLKNGWSPTVLSVRNPDPNYCSIGKVAAPDGIYCSYSYSVINFYKILGRLNGLISRLAGFFGLQIKRNYWYDFFCLPDPFGGWIPLAVIKGFNLIKSRKIDTIYVSCSPFSSALVGVLLKTLTNKPLVIDFRDPFALDIVDSHTSLPKWRHSINKCIETFIIKHSDVFIVNNEGTKTAYLSQYPKYSQKIFAVHNGFELTDIVFRANDKFPKFTVVYAGQFYWYASKSLAFFEALALLKSSGKITKDTFQFLFFGEGESKIMDLALAYSVDDLVVASPRIPFQGVLDVLAQSHMQLLKIVAPMLSTKLFEGIPLNIPFLAPISSPEAENIINTYSPASYVVPENSATEISEAISDAMEKYREDLIEPNRIDEFMDFFSRENLTLKMMNIINTKLFSHNS